MGVLLYGYRIDGIISYETVWDRDHRCLTACRLFTWGYEATLSN